LRRNGHSNSETIWALKDVSFEVYPGEVVGIIGRNGAGKSTLLKILSRITEPTTGRVELYGRVGSLLEVGTGFHPELTGRENIYLNGAILGMTRREIDKKFDEIVDFAEIEKFIDTPVKHYSSGMYMRLAFAVAAHLEPEILIVDEVLAVGDGHFQRKCLDKMAEVSLEGRTVLFVSHNLDAICKLCTRSMLLISGKLRANGRSFDVVRDYYEHEKNKLKLNDQRNSKESLGFVEDVLVEDETGEVSSVISFSRPWQVRIRLRINSKLENFVIGVGLTSNGLPVTTSWSKPYSLQPGKYEAVFREEKLLLAPGSYHLVIGLSEKGQSFQYIERAAFLEIKQTGFATPDPRIVAVYGVGLVLNQMDSFLERKE
jgi:lipopolysaccharide transport system ATP-binding protein